MMIELQLLDGRTLRFQEGEQTRRTGAGLLKEQDIAAIATDDLRKSERSLRGPDFLLSESGNPNRRLAVELKRKSSSAMARSAQAQLDRYAKDLARRFGQAIPLQLWLLSSDSSGVEVLDYTPERGLQTLLTYHLTDISSREVGDSASTDSIVAGRVEIDTKHILARVDNWEQRIRDLYGFIGEWCSSMPEIRLDQSLTISVNEEMMQRYAVSARKVPILRLMRGMVVMLSFKPYGLWIVGANGRIDVIAPKASYFLIDSAEQFSTSIWKLYGSDEKRIQNQRLSSGIDFTPDVLGALLSA